MVLTVNPPATLTEKSTNPKQPKPVCAAECREYRVLAAGDEFLLRRKLLRRLAISFSKTAGSKLNKPAARPDG